MLLSPTRNSCLYNYKLTIMDTNEATKLKKTPFHNRGPRVDPAIGIPFEKRIFIAGNCLIAIGVLSNLFVCAVMLRFGRRNKNFLSNFFILQLSITDLVFRASGIYNVIVDTLSEEILSDTQCKVIIFSYYTCAAAIFVLLAGIAVDRYQHIATVRPAMHLGRKRQQRYLLVALTWGYAVLVSSGFIFSVTNRSHPMNPALNASAADQAPPPTPSDLTSHDDCFLGPVLTIKTEIAISVYSMFGFFIPLVIMAAAYAKTISFLWKQAKSNLTNSVVARSKLKVTSMLIAVVVSFIISWGPVMVLDLLAVFGVGHELLLGNYPARPIFRCISFTSSIMNPVIYAFGNSNFRKMTRTMCCPAKLSRVIPRGPSINFRYRKRHSASILNSAV